MKVKLDHTPPEDQGTILIFPGQVVGGQWDGLHVRVAIDHRPAATITSALEQEAEVTVEPEPWQVLL